MSAHAPLYQMRERAYGRITREDFRRASREAWLDIARVRNGWRYREENPEK